MNTDSVNQSQELSTVPVESPRPALARGFLGDGRCYFGSWSDTTRCKKKATWEAIDGDGFMLCDAHCTAESRKKRYVAIIGNE